MWLLYENDEVVYRLLASPASQEIKIGRSQQCEVVVHDNVRLSRVCATIKASAVKVNNQTSADKATYTLTVTDTSKLGLLLNDQPVVSKSSVAILNRDVMQFVGDDSNSQYMFRWHGMVICESQIQPQHRSTLSTATSAIGCIFTKAYSEACTHVLLGKNALTPKAILAIIDQKPVVTLPYLQQLTSSDEVRSALPSPLQFISPAINDASVRNALSIAAQPDGKQRTHLLNGKSVVFALQRSYDELDSVIRAVGAKQSVVARLDAGEHWWEELGEFVVVQPTISKRSLQSSQATQASQISHDSSHSAVSDVASLIVHLRQQGILDETTKGLTDEKAITSAIVLANVEQIHFTRVSTKRHAQQPPAEEVIVLDDSVDLPQQPTEQLVDDHNDVQSITSDTTATTIVLDQPAAVKEYGTSANSDKVNNLNKFAASPDQPALHSSENTHIPATRAEEPVVSADEVKQSLDPFEHVPPAFVAAAVTPLKEALKSVDHQATDQPTVAQPVQRSGNRFAPSLMSQKRKLGSNSSKLRADEPPGDQKHPTIETDRKTAPAADATAMADESDDDTGWGVIPTKPAATKHKAKPTSSNEPNKSPPLKRKNDDSNGFTSSKRRSMVDGMTLNAFGLGSPMPQSSDNETVGGSEPLHHSSDQDRYDFPAPQRLANTATQPNAGSQTQNVKKFRKQWPKGYTPPNSASE